MSSNESKPTKGDIDKLIREAKINVGQLGMKKVQLIAKALEKDDPLEFIRSIARQQAIQSGAASEEESQDESGQDDSGQQDETEDSTAEPGDTASGETNHDDTDPPQPPEENVRRGEEVMRQSDQHTPFCPYCSDPAKNVYVQCKASGTKGPYTYYVCVTKGCDFSTKRARPVVARVYQRMNELARAPRVNARE